MPPFLARLASRLVACAPMIALVGSLACRDPAGPPERILTFEVAASLVPCNGPFPMTCLQVRERADAAWQLFYDPIAGFTHEVGYQYMLRVARRDVPNPPADGSSVAYRLVAVLTKVAVPANE